MSQSFLFYSEDFLMGTLSLPMEDRGEIYYPVVLYEYVRKNKGGNGKAIGR